MEPLAPGTLRRISGLRTSIVILSIIMAASTIISTLLTPTLRDTAEDLLSNTITDDDFNADYAPLAIFQTISTVGQVALMVVSMIWLYRIAQNVRLFGRRTTWAPLWAVFGWLLPPIVFVIPFLMLREMWKASDPQCPNHSDSWKQGAESLTLIVWFLLYGVTSAVLAVMQTDAIFSQGFGVGADSLAESVKDFDAVNLAGGVATALAALMWAQVAREISARNIELTGER